MASASLTALALLARHRFGDWGDLDAHDRRANDRAVHNGSRVLGAYQAPTGRVGWITEPDRSATTLLLPEEY